MRMVERRSAISSSTRKQAWYVIGLCTTVTIVLTACSAQGFDPQAVADTPATNVAAVTTTADLPPASPAADATVGTFAALQAAVTAATTTDSGAVTLGANVTAGAGQRLDVPIGQPVTLDLNGYTLTITDPVQTQAAIHVRIGASLTITDPSGTGTVTAGTTKNGFGAAIGGDVGENGGAITIDSGKVNATAVQGAGIGGGYGGVANPGGIGATVTVNGGVVDAKSVDGGAGIGGGSGVAGGNGGVVSINGGIVTATASNTAPQPVVGAAIGGAGGNRGGAGATLTISGGYVVAQSSIGTGIGGGSGSPGGPGGIIHLFGGSITASSTNAEGAGIGGGVGANQPGVLTLDGASTGLPVADGGTGTGAPGAAVGPRSPLTPALEYTANVSTGHFEIGFSWDS